MVAAQASIITTGVNSSCAATAANPSTASFSRSSSEIRFRSLVISRC